MAALVLAALLAGCGKSKPELFDRFVVTDHAGQPLPDKPEIIAGDAIDLAIAYQGGSLTEFGDRPLQAPEDWRFFWEMKDSKGKTCMPKGVVPIFEFHTYGELGTEGTVGRNSSLIWSSPEQAPPEHAGLIARWGRIRTPVEPGEYTLLVMAYPTADPRRYDEERPTYGQSIEAFRLPFTIVSAEPGQEPVRPNTAGVQPYSSPQERKRMLQNGGSRVGPYDPTILKTLKPR
ncbi:MAG: hypothetical protein KF774_20480 [Planctomyces sp.]|nr:hypothetical protein [Planctomyces sp.]